MTTDRPPSRRSGGVLLHPTSLPGPYGIGDLGPAAYHWVDALVRAGQTWWQVLPLGPTAYGDSPYQSPSALAGNPNLISPDALREDGLLTDADIGQPHFPINNVDYAAVGGFKNYLLETAWDRFRAGAAPALRPAFDAFTRAEAGWLDDFALYMAVKDAHQGAGWAQWPPDLARHEPAAVGRARRDHADRIEQHRFRQFLFFRQCGRLKDYANGKGLKLIGDVPIFVSDDSADFWANRELFLVDAAGRPKVVAGVPPDYFSPTGQLWGNPHYDWEAHRRTGYAWWLARLRATLRQVDLVRLDHFRGFEDAWHVPTGAPTAETGAWVAGPRDDFLNRVREALGGLPFIAEDLGDITPAVTELRDRFALPGMRIIQFAFDGLPHNPFLPHNYERHTVAYTGTHDNDTTRGWYESRPDEERHRARRYLSRDGSDIAWDFIRLAWASVADYAIAPLQDLLNLGTWARMNMPGRPEGNWRWRYTSDQPVQAALDRLADLTELFERQPQPAAKA